MDYPRYDPASPVTPLRDTELDHLDQLLQHLPRDDAMTLDGVDGFLTAWLVGPAALRALPTGQWLPAVWGGDGPAGMDEAAPFASKRQRKDTVVQLLRHLRHLDQVLTQSPDEWQPVFSIAEHGDDEWADAQDWCAGFLAAVDLLPDPWADTWRDPASAPLLALGGGVEGVPLPVDLGIAGGDLGTPEAIDALSRAVPAFVLQLRGRPGKDAS